MARTCFDVDQINERTAQGGAPNLPRGDIGSKFLDVR